MFEKGSYRDLELEGPDASHWLAFAREYEGEALIAAVPRFPATWAEQHDARIALDAELPDREWTELLTGGTVRAGGQLELTNLPIPWSVLYSRK